jgi:hypothetical protein
MEWFSRKTSIAGIQIPNWVVVLCAIIVNCSSTHSCKKPKPQTEHTSRCAVIVGGSNDNGASVRLAGRANDKLTQIKLSQSCASAGRLVRTGPLMARSVSGV